MANEMTLAAYPDVRMGTIPSIMRCKATANSAGEAS
jgi:hypothetical protein